jgi:quaternary ammonium compound-resistance protein SugE
MQSLPVGTAYAIFTGIGAVGAVTLGIIIYHDPVSIGRLAAVGLILAGVILARLTTAG